MKSLFDFIVKPVGERYSNEVKVGDKSLVINTQLETFKAVNNIAKVIEVPIAFKSVIKVGDLIMIHHNVFRTFYNMKGIKKNSKSYFKDDLYFVQMDQVYLYKPKDKWITINDRCFVSPIKDFNEVDTGLEQKLIGILKYGNNSLEALGIVPGDVVSFPPKREWEFALDGELLYCMKSNDIVIKYEHKEDKVKYNPSWASSRRRVNQGS